MTGKENGNKPKLVVIAGCAASGKTTIARELAKEMGAAYVDKDDATRRFTDLTLILHGHSPQDRESDFYIDHIRDVEYATMFAIALGNLELGSDVVVSAPFLNAIGDAGKWAELRYPLSNDAYDVHIVWIDHDVEVEHARMVERNAIRDGNKLEKWGDYVESVNGIAPDPRLEALIVDNPDDRAPGRTAHLIFEAIDDKESN